jgi:two-component system, response regulator, stage 0 sporulation protein F
MSKKQVFIIDDQVGIRLLLKEIVESVGYSAKAFESGVTALKESEKNKPHLLFVDYNMPVMNGTEFVRQLIEQQNIEIPVVLMSGFSKEEINKHDNIPLIKELLIKPFDVEHIIQILHKYLKD